MRNTSIKKTFKELITRSKTLPLVNNLIHYAHLFSLSLHYLKLRHTITQHIFIQYFISVLRLHILSYGKYRNGYGRA